MYTLELPINLAIELAFGTDRQKYKNSPLWIWMVENCSQQPEIRIKGECYENNTSDWFIKNIEFKNEIDMILFKMRWM